jgi:pimeloyl-ACP methyl ester carboxylesterase
MNAQEFHATRKFADTPFGRIAYVERGNGPAALFLHGAFLNGFHWRDVIDGLGDVRRCIAPDILAHGHTELLDPNQDLSFPAQADMLAALIDALGVDRVDLVGNDSGGAIAQLFAARHPDRLRTLTLTNCDVHDNWPPETFGLVMAQARARALHRVGGEMLTYPALARSDFGLGVGFEHPERIAEETIRTYLEPLLASKERAALLERYFLAWDNQQTVAIQPALARLKSSTLIVWGMADIFFPPRWAHWLGEKIPGTRKIVLLPTARLFFPEEYPDLLVSELRQHWAAEGA